MKYKMMVEVIVRPLEGATLADVSADIVSQGFQVVLTDVLNNQLTAIVYLKDVYVDTESGKRWGMVL